MSTSRADLHASPTIALIERIIHRDVTCTLWCDDYAGWGASTPLARARSTHGPTDALRRLCGDAGPAGLRSMVGNASSDSVEALLLEIVPAVMSLTIWQVSEHEWVVETGWHPAARGTTLVAALQALRNR